MEEQSFARVELLNRNDVLLSELLEKCRVVYVDGDRNVLMNKNSPWWNDKLSHDDDDIIYLGSDNDGWNYFCRNLSDKDQHHDVVSVNLRSLVPVLDPLDLSRVGKAVVMKSWNLKTRFCSRCGKQTKSLENGSKRVCKDNPAHRFYPRTDPVIIVLVVRGDKVLLGRSKNIPSGILTCLAGFMEPCESIEEATIREVKEESGISCSDVTLVGSQPWPLGRGGNCELMIACFARSHGNESIEIDKKEMAECRWVGREQLRKAMEYSTTSASPFSPEYDPAKRKAEDFVVPPPYTIAHSLMKLWLNDHPKL